MEITAKSVITLEIHYDPQLSGGDSFDASHSSALRTARRLGSLIAGAAIDEVDGVINAELVGVHNKLVLEVDRTE